MWLVWVTAANAQNLDVFTTPPSGQLVDGSIRLRTAVGTDVGQVLTCRDGTDAVEVWASKVGPESLTGGFSMEFLTGPRTYQAWAPALDADAQYDNWTAMTFTYANDVPVDPQTYPNRFTSVSFQMFNVFVNDPEADIGGFTNGGDDAPVVGQLHRETYRSGATVVQYIDYWVFLEGYHAPQEAGDWVSVEPTLFAVDADAFHDLWADDDDVVKYARIAYGKPLANPGVWPAASWPDCGD